MEILFRTANGDLHSSPLVAAQAEAAATLLSQREFLYELSQIAAAHPQSEGAVPQDQLLIWMFNNLGSITRLSHQFSSEVQ